MSTKTTMPRDAEATHGWRLVDADGKPAGRLAAEIAAILRGKDRPDFTPHVDMGDFVVVVNAEKVLLTGAKEWQKEYRHYTGYPNGLKSWTAAQVRARHPERILTQAVRGMLPKNRLSRQQIKRLKVYPGATHPHEAQRPVPCELAQ